MADKTPAQKMFVKPGMSVALVDAPEGMIDILILPDDITFVDDLSVADAIVAFATTQAAAEALLPRLRDVADDVGLLWVCYPKGSKAAGLDISRDTMWPFAETLGLRPLSMVSVDATWSAMRFRMKS